MRVIKRVVDRLRLQDRSEIYKYHRARRVPSNAQAAAVTMLVGILSAPSKFILPPEYSVLQNQKHKIVFHRTREVESCKAEVLH